MSIGAFFESALDSLLFFSAIIILLVSVVLTAKTRVVQLRMLPHMVKTFFSSIVCSKKKGTDAHTVLPHKALFTAMSTTLGISTMISPVIAIRLGGPGALVGYLLTTIFGSAVTFTEVALSMTHRKKLKDGRWQGGPMQYIENLISSKIAKGYALFCLLLMTAWSGAQSNQLAAILYSPLVGDFAIPKVVTGAFLAIVVISILLGGVRWISEFSAKIVPLMFTLYVGASLWIVLSNIERIPELVMLVIKSTFAPYEMATGVAIGGLSSALRWGIFKGVHSNEAGLGTQTIPHAMASADPTQQGILAMAATYSAGFVAILSGFVALITNTWQDPGLSLGIDMVAASYQMYFSNAGIAIVAACAFLFGIGTALGNSYNGGHCFQYLTSGRWTKVYYIASAVVIFFGATSHVTFFWGWCDIFVALAAVTNVLSLMWIFYTKNLLFSEKEILSEVSKET
jgi:AGCS family alanine or glycine:cation symporter